MQILHWGVFVLGNDENSRFFVQYCALKFLKKVNIENPGTFPLWLLRADENKNGHIWT